MFDAGLGRCFAMIKTTTASLLPDSAIMLTAIISTLLANLICSATLGRIRRHSHLFAPEELEHVHNCPEATCRGMETLSHCRQDTFTIMLTPHIMMSDISRFTTVTPRCKPRRYGRLRHRCVIGPYPSESPIEGDLFNHRTS